MKKYEFIIFDMDGTFMDSREFHTKVFYRFFNRNIGTVSYDVIAQKMGNTVKDIFLNFGIQEKC